MHYRIHKKRYFGKIFQTSIKAIDLRAAIKLYLCDMSQIWDVEFDSFRKTTVGFQHRDCLNYTGIRRVSTDELNKTRILPGYGEFRPTVFTDKGYIS